MATKNITDETFEEEVLKADEDGFIDIRNIEWFAD